MASPSFLMSSLSRRICLLTSNSEIVLLVALKTEQPKHIFFRDFCVPMVGLQPHMVTPEVSGGAASGLLDHLECEEHTIWYHTDCFKVVYHKTLTPPAFCLGWREGETW